MAQRKEPFSVDLADPRAIQHGLDRAHREVVTRRDAVKEAVEALHYWETLYARLAALAGKPLDEAAARSRGSVRHRVETTVNESDTPIDVDRLETLMPDVKRKTLSWTLWDLERKGKIQRLTDGVYARLDFRPDSLTDAA